MKYLLVLLVVVIGLWLLLRDRAAPPPGPGGDRGRRRGADAAEPVVACAHCGLHLPRHDAIEDAAGRPFCSDAHRLAGPR